MDGYEAKTTANTGMREMGVKGQCVVMSVALRASLVFSVISVVEF